ncbi:MAG: PIN domain-containing protein [Myxococcota bacterium]
MKILVDTDVLLDVALAREPHADASATLLDVIESGLALGFMTSHSIATFYYLLDSSRSRGEPVDMIRDLLEFMQVASLDTRAVKEATVLPLRDFEDSMQVVAALGAQCDVIATRNTKDFKASPVRAASPKSLLGELEAS